MRTPRRGGSRRPGVAYTVGGTLVSAFFLFCVFSLGRFWPASPGAGAVRTSHERAWAFRGSTVDTLVVYIFSATVPEYVNNLNFF